MRLQLVRHGRGEIALPELEIQFLGQFPVQEHEARQHGHHHEGPFAGRPEYGMPALVPQFDHGFRPQGKECRPVQQGEILGREGRRHQDHMGESPVDGRTALLQAGQGGKAALHGPGAGGGVGRGRDEGEDMEAVHLPGFRKARVECLGPGHEQPSRFPDLHINPPAHLDAEHQ